MDDDQNVNACRINPSDLSLHIFVSMAASCALRFPTLSANWIQRWSNEIRNENLLLMHGIAWRGTKIEKEIDYSVDSID